MRFLFIVLLISQLFLSCEREITFQLDQPASKLVVEAFIENGEPPMVRLIQLHSSRSSKGFYVEAMP